MGERRASLWTELPLLASRPVRDQALSKQVEEEGDLVSHRSLLDAWAVVRVVLPGRLQVARHRSVLWALLGSERVAWHRHEASSHRHGRPSLGWRGMELGQRCFPYHRQALLQDC